jgi:glycosyltransferase involved in cell wall biosynthesis
MLQALYTDICSAWPPMRLLRHLPTALQPGPLRRVQARVVPDVPRDKIRCFAGFSLARLLSRGKRENRHASRAMYVRANQHFGRRCTQSGLGGANAVYAYNGAALELFQLARAAGAQTFLDQTSAPVHFEERLLAEERARWPEWESTPDTDTAVASMAVREAEEWALSDRIFCGSDFVRDCLVAQGVDAARTVVNPYGIHARFTSGKPRPRSGSTLRVLYVGGIRLQKGLPYLMEAAHLLKNEDVHFRVVGPVLLAERGREALAEVFDLPGPIDRARIISEYEKAHVLVFPSLCEGSANVCFEALAMGLPVITTAHAGSVVRDGLDGFVVPVRSGEALAEKIRSLAVDEDLRFSMAQSAHTHAQAYTWEACGARLVAAIGAVRP